MDQKAYSLYQAKRMISKDKTDEALKLIEQSKVVANNIIRELEARLNRIKTQQRAQLLTQEQINVERNRLNHQLLIVIRQAQSGETITAKEMSSFSDQDRMMKLIEEIHTKIAEISSSGLQVEFDSLRTRNPRAYDDLLANASKIESLRRKLAISQDNNLDFKATLNASSVKPLLDQYFSTIEKYSNDLVDKTLRTKLLADPRAIVRNERDIEHSKSCKALLNQRLAVKQHLLWTRLGLTVTRMTSPAYHSWSSKDDTTVFGKEYDDDGYDKEGFNPDGHDRSGFDKQGKNLKLGYSFDGEEVKGQNYISIDLGSGLQLSILPEDTAKEYEKLINNETTDEEPREVEVNRSKDSPPFWDEDDDIDSEVDTEFDFI